MGSCYSGFKHTSNKIHPIISNIKPVNKVINIKPVNKVISIKYKKKTIPKTVKKAAWDKWIGPTIGQAKCLCCGHQDIRQIDFHCGHIISEKEGGKTNVENLKPICSQCNLSMGTMNLIDFQKKYF